MYHPLQISNYFINKSFEDGVQITPMKVLKLTYIAHGWYLALTDHPLINEQTEAWKYGPVVRSVYDAFKRYGKGDINQLAFGFGSSVTLKPIKDNKQVTDLLDDIWRIYGRLSGTQLSNLTHQPGTPWDITWNNNGGSLKRGAIIPNKLIRKHYKSLLA